MVAEMVLPTNGILKKWTNYVSGWQDRYFEIKSGNLQYYKSKHEQSFGCRGSLSLRSVNVMAHEFDECEFTVSVGSELVWYLKAENCHSKQLWMRSILRDSHDSDYSSTSTTKSHSRNSSALSSLSMNNALEDNQQFNVRISEIEAYRTMCCEQMNSIQRELNVLLDPSTPSLLSIKATHLALLNNINRIIEIMKVSDQNETDTCFDDPSLEENESVGTVRDSRPLSSVDITSGDEWHDADEHSSFGSIEQGEEARASATPSPRASVEPVPQKVAIQRNLPFGHYDDVLIPNKHKLYEEVEVLATEQLRYALAGVEDNVWTLFAQDGAMRMFTREIQDEGGLPVDPLKAIHEVKGVTALEFMHYFFDAKYKMDWDHTLNDMKIVEAVSRDTFVLHQKHKTVWPAAPRESLFVSHIRRVDEHKRKDAHDLYIVCNKDIKREDVPLGSSSSVRVGLTVSMICETVILNPNKNLDELTRDDIKCNIIYVSQDHAMLAKQFRFRKYCKLVRNRWILSIITIIFLLEECFGDGYCRLLFVNMYSSEFALPIDRARNHNQSVGIVVVVDSSARANQYSLARSTVQCYADLHSYNFHYVDISTFSNMTKKCPQKDLMFRRHCFVSWMAELWDDEWLLFLDADIGVMNPNNLLESFIPQDTEIELLFYDRIFNHEIMAGSYLFRNNNRSREFLLFWANYENRLPESFHGSDNGAIHSALLDFYSSADQRLHSVCKDLWKQSFDYNSLAKYVVCMRILLTKYPPIHVNILQKGRRSWARDGWLTNSQWSSRDFLFHGWQLRRLNHRGFAEWHLPLVYSNWDSDLCHNHSEAHLNWRYKDSFYKSNVYIDRILHSKIERVSLEYKTLVSNIMVIVDMNATVGSSAANVKSERHKVPFLAEILDGAKQFGSAHQYILQYMLKYGQVTQKRFYIEFMNYYVTMLLDRDEHVVSRIDATLPQLVELVSTILDSCNDKAQKIGIQLAQARREVDDQQVVSIITQKGFSPPLADRYGASPLAASDKSADYTNIQFSSQDEKVFLSRMVGEFAQSNGRLTKEAMNELPRYLPNLNSAKFEKILNKLLDQQWISETDEHYYLEPRSIAELGPLLRAKYNTPTCVFCQVLILDRDEAGFCEKCDINAHSFCIDKLAKDGELNCPLACGSKFTRGERTTPIEKSSSSTEQRAIKRENEDIEMMEPSTSKRPVIREIQDTGVNVGRKQKPA